MCLMYLHIIDVSLLLINTVLYSRECSWSITSDFLNENFLPVVFLFDIILIEFLYCEKTSYKSIGLRICCFFSLQQKFSLLAEPVIICLKICMISNIFGRTLRVLVKYFNQEVWSFIASCCLPVICFWTSWVSSWIDITYHNCSKCSFHNLPRMLLLVLQLILHRILFISC